MYAEQTSQKRPKINDHLNVAMHALDKARYEQAASRRTDMRSNGMHKAALSQATPAQPYIRRQAPSTFSASGMASPEMLAPTSLPPAMSGLTGLTRPAIHTLPRLPRTRSVCPVGCLCV
jgi:hypothetical protein